MTISKWRRGDHGGLFRQIHGGSLIGQYIVRSSRGWALTDCPSEYGKVELRTEHARFVEAKRHADKRLKQRIAT